MKTFKVLLVLLMISSIVLCADERGRRRKVRRKVLRRPVQEVVNVYEPELIPEEGRSIVFQTEDSVVPELSEKKEIEPIEDDQQDIVLIEEDRAGRG